MLSDKLAIVTGGASGIGRGTALALAKHGANIIVADTRETPREGGTPTQELVPEETDSECTYLECDVGHPSEIREVIDVAEEMGGVDVMVNNAAIVQEVDMNVEEDQYDRIMDVNTKGVFYGTRYAAHKMADGDGGSIVNIASPEGFNAVAQRPVYSASRAAVPIISNACAGYFGPENVRVNTIHPGMVRTEMVIQDTKHIPRGEGLEQQYIDASPLRKIGEPEEIGNVVVFLASELSSNVTAEEITVDCGATGISGTSISRQEYEG